MTTHYEVLGVRADASPEAIRSAYRGLAKRYHPDGISGDADRFKRISAAYDALKGDRTRRAYDLLLARRSVAIAAPPCAATFAVWRQGFLGLLVAAAGVWCWFRGDVKGHYNGWFVAAGWLLVILGWRIFAERKQAFRNPLASLTEGVLLAVGGVVSIGLSVVGVAIALIAIAGSLGVIEHLTHR